MPSVGIKEEARKFCKSGKFPQYLNSASMKECKLFWQYVKVFDK